MATFYSNRRGGENLSYQGYSYRKNTTNKNTINWRCTEKDCLGSASTAKEYRENVEVKTLREHNHAPDPARQTATLALATMEEAACTSAAPPRRIISATMQDLDEESMFRMPKRKAMRVRIQRKRMRLEGGIEREPDSIETFIIPQNYRIVTINGEEQRFLLHDDRDEWGDDEEAEAEPHRRRIIIFATNCMLQQLATAQTWMCDGTFKVVPKLHYQLYTIHGIRLGSSLPCVYMLLPDKTQTTYTRALNVLSNAQAGLQPDTIVMDFEKAAIAAFHDKFPDARVQGCFFTYRKLCGGKFKP